MIRSVQIPRLGRLRDGTLEMNVGCVSYLDPTGLWIADDNTSANCTAGDGSSSASPVVGDPGLSSALESFAASTNAQSNTNALNSISLFSTSGNPASTPIPGPGLGLVTLPSPLQTILKWAAVGLIVFIILGQQHATISRAGR